MYYITYNVYRITYTSIYRPIWRRMMFPVPDLYCTQWLAGVFHWVSGFARLYCYCCYCIVTVLLLRGASVVLSELLLFLLLLGCRWFTAVLSGSLFNLLCFLWVSEDRKVEQMCPYVWDKVNSFSFHCHCCCFCFCSCSYCFCFCCTCPLMLQLHCCVAAAISACCVVGAVLLLL